MPDEIYDIAIVGAGINGAGIARDAALRGLKVVIIDRDDLCSGTSWASSRLIHGGLRYLEHAELALVFESLRERIILRRIAPHLICPLRITIPVYRGARRGPLLIRLGMIAYDLLSLGKTAPRHDMLGRDEILREEPGLAADGLRAAARYFDAQVTFAERLVLENILGALAAGARLMTHTEVRQLIVDEGRVSALACVDRLTGRDCRVTARAVINAAGPWVDDVLDSAHGPHTELIGGTKGSHIIVGAFAGAPKDAFYVEAASDGRPFFIIPWNRQYLIGTTDIRYEGDPGEVRASTEEIEYLLAETNRVFPGAALELADIHFTYAGVRPLPKREKGPESAITRRHIIRPNQSIADNLVSIIGGKLTTYRSLAEQTVDGLEKILGRKLPASRTQTTLLPGAHGLVQARTVLEAVTALSAAGVERLLNIYGGRASMLIELASTEADACRTLDEAGTVLAAEVAFALREENARTLIDIVYRRMMLGLEPDQGRPHYEAIASLAAAARDWPAARRSEELEALLAFSDSFAA